MAVRLDLALLTAAVAVLAGVLGLVAAGIQYRRHAAIDWFDFVMSFAFVVFGVYVAARSRRVER